MCLLMEKSSANLLHQAFQRLIGGLTLLTVAVACIGLPNLVNAQDENLSPDANANTKATQETETWLGTLDVGVAKLRLQLQIEDADSEEPQATLISIDQGDAKIPITSFSRSEKGIEFACQRPVIKYAGKLSDDGQRIVGTFTQGRDFELVFERVDKVTPDQLVETWQGKMDAGGVTFDFQFRIFNSAIGDAQAAAGGEDQLDPQRFTKLDSFTESIFGLPCVTTRKNERVTIRIDVTDAEFVGAINANHDSIVGIWKQRGNEIPLTLAKIPVEQTRLPELKRPQTPQPPFDYQAIDFKIKLSEIDERFAPDVTIAGTMTLPSSAEESEADGSSNRLPAVILITGSGPQDRDETIFEHKPFLVLADHLTKLGFAVIRFDERGVGESTGNFSQATSADFAADVEAIFLWAQAQRMVDPEKIVLAGHSEGGLIAPLVAIRQPQIGGVIMLAGPGVDGGEIILNQTRKIAALAGVPEKVLAMQDSMLEKVVAQIKSGEPFPDNFAETLAADFADLSDEEKQKFAMADVGQKTIAALDNPWMKHFVRYDPQPTLKQLNCPTLSLIGSLDIQVDPALNVPAIESALARGEGRPAVDFTQKTLPELNHLFQRAKTGAVSEYISIEETLNERMLQEVSDWLTSRFNQ